MAEHEFVVPPAEFGAGSPVLAGMLIVFFVGCVWAVLAVRSFVEFRGRNSSLVGVKCNTRDIFGRPWYIETGYIPVLCL